MKFDLHCHSYYSDGSHPPDFLMHRAVQNGVTHLSITDHDCIEVYKQELAIPTELKLVSGVEISCAWDNQEIHIVGLGIDVNDQSLNSLLAAQQASRTRRTTEIAHNLAKITQADLAGYFESLPCISRTRTHIAHFLVAEGICKNHQQAFKKYLSRSGKIYSPASWCSLEEAISSIDNAGGIAVLAHPSRYPYTRKKLIRLIENFKESGGSAIETAYSNLSPITQKNLELLCEETSLYASAGSDFHSAENRWTDIGKFHRFAEGKKNAIWNHPKWHFTDNA
ncbi:MAG: PHP domain-containing protein [Pseudohongiellaceae bacterium]